MGEALIVRKGGGSNTPLPTLLDETFVQNGLYRPSDYNADGFNNVIVNVQSGLVDYEKDLLLPVYSATLKSGRLLRIGKFAVVCESSLKVNGTVKLINLETSQILHTTSGNTSKVPTGYIYDTDGDILIETSGNPSSLNNTSYFRWWYKASTDTWTFDDTTSSSGYGTGMNIIYKGKDYGIVRGYSTSYGAGFLVKPDCTKTGNYAFGTKYSWSDDNYNYFYYASNSNDVSRTIGIIKENKSDNSFVSKTAIGYDYTYAKQWRISPDGKYALQSITMNRSYGYIYNMHTQQTILSTTLTAAAPTATVQYNNGFIYVVSGVIHNYFINTITDSVSANTVSISGVGTISRCYAVGNDCIVVASGGVFYIDRANNTYTDLTSTVNMTTDCYVEQLTDTDYYICSSSGSKAAFIYRIGNGIIQTLNSDLSITQSLKFANTPIVHITLTIGVTMYNLSNSYKLVYCETEDSYHLIYCTVYSTSDVLSANDAYIVFKYNNISTENGKIALVSTNGIRSILDLGGNYLPSANIGSSQTIFSYNNAKYFSLSINSHAQVIKYTSLGLSFSTLLNTSSFTPICLGGVSYQTQGNYIIFAPVIKNSIYVLNTRNYTNTTGNYCVYYDTVNDVWYDFSNCSAAHIQIYDTNKIVYRVNTSPYNIHIYDITNETDTDTGYATGNAHHFTACANGNIFIRTTSVFIKYSLVDNSSESLGTHSNNTSDTNYGYTISIGNKVVSVGYYAIYFGESTITKITNNAMSSSPYFTYIDDAHCYIYIYVSSQPLQRNGFYESINFSDNTYSKVTGMCFPISFTDYLTIKPYSTSSSGPFNAVITRYNVVSGTQTIVWTFTRPNDTLVSYSLLLAQNKISLSWTSGYASIYDLDTFNLNSTSGGITGTYRYFLWWYFNSLILLDTIEKKLYNYIKPYIGDSDQQYNTTNNNNGFNAVFETTDGFVVLSTSTSGGTMSPY